MSNKTVKNIFEWIICILIALVIVSIIKSFVGFPTVVSGASMDSTLKDKQRLWVSKIGIEFDKYPKKGDIITFEAPSNNYINKAMYKKDDPTAIYNEEEKSFFDKLISSVSFFNTTSYIKRVIGLPGDHVVIKEGKVFVNDQAINEEYLDAGVRTYMRDGMFSDVIVPDGYVYVLGDNREVSADSRRFGCIPVNKIEGKAVFRFWPLNKMGKLK